MQSNSKRICEYKVCLLSSELKPEWQHVMGYRGLAFSKDDHWSGGIIIASMEYIHYLKHSAEVSIAVISTHIRIYIPQRHSFDFLFSRLWAVVGDPPSDSTLAKCRSLCLATSAEERPIHRPSSNWPGRLLLSCAFILMCRLLLYTVRSQESSRMIMGLAGEDQTTRPGLTWLEEIIRSPWKVAVGRESENNKTAHF